MKKVETKSLGRRVHEANQNLSPSLRRVRQRFFSDHLQKQSSLESAWAHMNQCAFTSDQGGRSLRTRHDIDTLIDQKLAIDEDKTDRFVGRLSGWVG